MGIFSSPYSVPVQDVKSHLLIMAAFQSVHQKVEKSGVQLDSFTGLPIPTSHAVLFLARSLQRFELWISTLEELAVEPGLRSTEILPLPPLDVLMFLHAYMLSPLDFYEDSLGRHKVLARVGEFPLSRVAQLINKETLEFTPTKEQVKHWEKTTSSPFDIPFDGPTSETFSVNCPRCLARVAVTWAEVTVPKHPSQFSGPQDYANPVFHARCAKCQLSITPNTLCAGRFLHDIYSSHVTHTLLDDTGTFPDLETAQAVSVQMANALGDNLGQKTAGDTYDWDVGRIVQCLSSRLSQTSDFQRNFVDIVAAYSHPNNFSVDLSKAVLRQARFIFQMSAMGWLDEGRFDSNDGALLQAMQYYEQFISLDSLGIIARWDLDLIWHTHQLSGSRYRSDTFRILGRVLDHDDTQSQDIIVNGTEHAEQVWKAKFGQSYLTPDDPDLVSSLAKTVCGGVGGGSCFPNSPRGGGGGGSGGGSGGGGGGSGGSGGGGGSGRNQSATLKEFKSLEVLAH